MLAKFGLQSSRLDEPDTIAALLGGSIEVAKPSLTAPSGLLSNGDGYPDFANCVWTIKPAGATRITLTFNRFNMETDYDYVFVYDGLSTTDPLLATLTGESVPAPITSTQGAMLVVLKGDVEFSAGGFEAVYRADNARAGVMPLWQTAAGVCKEKTYHEHVSFACKMCVLATVSSVCGENCIADHLHIVDRTKMAKQIRPAPCLPALSLRLVSEQTKRLRDALELSEPFGLSLSAREGASDSLNVSDTYLPMPRERLFGSPVYVGIDTGRYMHACDPNVRPDLWVIASSLDRARLADCKGSVWFDLAIGAARNQVMFMVHTGLGDCTQTLSLAPAISSGALTLDSSAAAACWLMRFFGPQSSASQIAPTSIKLNLQGERTLRLLSDLVLRGGQRLAIIGDVIVVVQRRQIRVGLGAELRLEHVTVASSTASSAVLVEGRVIAANSTFRNCTARLNVLEPNTLDSTGGALYVARAGELVLNAAHVIDNAVLGGTGSTSGGGIYAIGAKVTVVDSTLQRNFAHATEGACNGGAIALVDGTTCEVKNSRLGENFVQGGRIAAGGAMYAISSTLRLLSCTIDHNTVHKALLWSRGGGLALTGGSSAVLDDTKVLQNVVADSLALNGGGIFVYQHSSIKLERTAIRGNVAERAGNVIYGAGLYLIDFCSAELHDVEVLDNRASMAEYAVGGGLFARDDCRVAISASVFRGNSASNASR